MHQYTHTSPTQAIQDYVQEKRRKKALMLLIIPPAIMLVSFLAIPLIKIFGYLQGSSDVMDELGYGVAIIYYVGNAVAVLAGIVWIPCAAIGIALLMASRSKR